MSVQTLLGEGANENRMVLRRYKRDGIQFERHVTDSAFKTDRTELGHQGRCESRHHLRGYVRLIVAWNPFTHVFFNSCYEIGVMQVLSQLYRSMFQLCMSCIAKSLL